MEYEERLFITASKLNHFIVNTREYFRDKIEWNLVIIGKIFIIDHNTLEDFYLE